MQTPVPVARRGEVGTDPSRVWYAVRKTWSKDGSRLIIQSIQPTGGAGPDAHLSARFEGKEGGL
jgi:hypothetical protein